jgi:hypothetical protein
VAQLRFDEGRELQREPFCADEDLPPFAAAKAVAAPNGSSPVTASVGIKKRRVLTRGEQWSSKRRVALSSAV